MIYGEETYRPRGEYIDIKLGIQMVYWTTLALFLKTWVNNLDFYQIGKYIFFGLFITSLVYFMFGAIRQNSFAYEMVLLVPISLYYIFKRFSLMPSIMISSILLIAAIASGSRTGAVIVFLEIVLYIGFSKLVRKKTFGLTVSFLTLILFVGLLSFN